MKKSIIAVLILASATAAHALDFDASPSAAVQYRATVVKVLPTNMDVVANDNGNKLLGATAGGVVGALAGRLLGGNSHKALGLLAGAGVGAYAGSKIAEGRVERTQVPALAITVRRDNGAKLVVTQPLEDDVSFSVGESVIVRDEAGHLRAVKDAGFEQTAEEALMSNPAKAGKWE